MQDAKYLFAPFTGIDGKFIFSTKALQISWERDTKEVVPLTKEQALAMCIHLPNPKDGINFINDVVDEKGRYIL